MSTKIIVGMLAVLLRAFCAGAATLTVHNDDTEVVAVSVSLQNNTNVRISLGDVVVDPANSHSVKRSSTAGESGVVGVVIEGADPGGGGSASPSQGALLWRQRVR